MRPDAAPGAAAQVAAELRAALESWLAAPDPRALRRSLVALLAQLD